MLWRKRPEGNEFPGAPVAAKIFRTSGNKPPFFSSFIPGSWERGRPRPHRERSSRCLFSRFALIADEDVRAPSKSLDGTSRVCPSLDRKERKDEKNLIGNPGGSNLRRFQFSNRVGAVSENPENLKPEPAKAATDSG